MKIQIKVLTHPPPGGSVPNKLGNKKEGVKDIAISPLLGWKGWGPACLPACALLPSSGSAALPLAFLTERRPKHMGAPSHYYLSSMHSRTEQTFKQFRSRHQTFSAHLHSSREASGGRHLLPQTQCLVTFLLSLSHPIMSLSKHLLSFHSSFSF